MKLNNSLNCLDLQSSLPGGNGELVPPDPIPNSEVKRLIADDSVGFPHVKVGHCQALNMKPSIRKCRGFFYVSRKHLKRDLPILIVGRRFDELHPYSSPLRGSFAVPFCSRQNGRPSLASTTHAKSCC